MFLMTEAFLKVAQPQNRYQSHIEIENLGRWYRKDRCSIISP